MTNGGAPARGVELTHRQVLTVMSGLLTSVFLSALDQTVVTTAMKTIGNDLNDLSAQAWATSAFLITATISAPLFGKLSDLYGRKWLLMLSIIVFIAGSALCGLSESMYELAAFRAFQGIGAGGLVPLAMAILADIIPPRERGRYQGYIMIVYGSATVLGPVVGGLLAGAHTVLGIPGWRWIFYINVPTAVLGLVVIARVVSVDRVRRRRRIDWFGACALSLCMVPLLIVAEQGRAWGWTSIGALTCYVLCLGNLALFLWTESRMGDDALLPLRLFRTNTFAVASAQATLVGMVMFGAFSVIPLYLQVVKGTSPAKSGLLILPQFAGLTLGTLVAGQITARTGRYKISPVIGSVLMVVGMGSMSRLGVDTPLWPTDIFMFVLGWGIGMNAQSLLLAMQNAVDPHDTGVATSTYGFFRSVGGTLGTSLFVALLFSAATSKIAGQYATAAHEPGLVAAIRSHPAQYALVHGHVQSDLNNTSFLDSISRLIAHPFVVGFSSAFDLVTALAAGLLVVAVVLACFLREIPLRLTSGNQARMQVETEQASQIAIDMNIPGAAG